MNSAAELHSGEDATFKALKKTTYKDLADFYVVEFGRRGWGTSNTAIEEINQFLAQHGWNSKEFVDAIDNENNNRRRHFQSS